MYLFCLFKKTRLCFQKWGGVYWLNVIVTEVPVEMLQSHMDCCHSFSFVLQLWLKKNKITEIIHYLVQYLAAYQCNSAL